MAQQHGSHGPHLSDPAAHVDAIATDLEYFRRKRLEPRVLYFARRGIVTLYDLLRTARTLDADEGAGEPAGDLERRIRALEDRLDAFVNELAAVTISPRSVDVVIDDTRRERGDYDEFFRIAPRRREGSLEERLIQLERELGECEDLLRTFTAALVANGEVTEEQLDEQRELRRDLGYRNGARIVARAWVDPEFRQRLLDTGREVVRELDIPPGRLGKLGIAENTDEVHNIVVCTLCSCYPHDLLGDPPWWYRTDEYKQRIVEDPRGMLREMFGFEVSADRAIAVRDSTSDVRWMVLPSRPPGTEGMTEEELAELVTPESLVGVAEVHAPRPVGGAQ